MDDPERPDDATDAPIVDDALVLRAPAAALVQRRRCEASRADPWEHRVRAEQPPGPEEHRNDLSTPTITRMRRGPLLLAVAATMAAVVGLSWPDIADAMARGGISHPDRYVLGFGCLELLVASGLLASAGARESGRRRCALVLVAVGAVVVAAATMAMAFGAEPTVGLITADGPTTTQILGMVVLIAGVTTMPSTARWSSILVIDVGLVVITAISLTWLAPVRTSVGPGGGLADVVAREPTAAVLVALMVAGVVLLVRGVQAARPGDMALVVAVLLIPSALYVSIVGQFAGHAALSVRTSTMWWLTGPSMLVVAGWQAVDCVHRRGRTVVVPVERAAAFDGPDARRSEGIAAAATLLTLAAVAAHRLFIDSLDPVMLDLGVVTVLASTGRLAIAQLEQSRMQERLGVLASTFHDRARTDELTGLGNRVALSELLRRLLDAGTAGIAVFYVDLDEFKGVNDALGHETGDRLLVATAERLVESFGHFVHRVGGDEFVAVRHDLDIVGAEELAREVVARSSEPIDIDGVLVPARMSLGVARIRPTDEELSEEDEVVRKADLALNRAKEMGRGRVVVYDEGLRERADRRMAVQQGLRAAVELDQIEATYRPVVDLATGAVVATEAVLRWRTVDDRLLVPNEYFEMAADTTLVPSLSRAGIGIAVAPWAGMDPPSMPLSISVTLQELANVGFVDDLGESLDGVPSEVIRLQIPEAVFMDPVAQPTIGLLVDRGVRMCVKDFGSAASSVRRLSGLHDASVRLHPSFVTGLDREGPDALIVGAVVGIGSELGVPVVAAGVTRPEQVLALMELGISQAEGWLFGRSVPWDAFRHRHLDPRRTSTGLDWRPPVLHATAPLGGRRW